MQFDSGTWIIWHHTSISAITVLIGNCIARCSGFPVIYVATLAHLPTFVISLRVVVIVIVAVISTIPDDSASDCAHRCRGNFAVAAADLAPYQTPCEAADDCAASAALLLTLGLGLTLRAFIFRSALLTWYIYLFQLRCHINNAGIFVKLGGMHGRCAKAERYHRSSDNCAGKFCQLHLHLDSRFLQLMMA